jgi:hypothetical protein
MTSSISGCRQCTIRVPVPSGLTNADFASIVSDALFGADQAPRFI